MPMALPDSHGSSAVVALLMESVLPRLPTSNSSSTLILSGVGALVFAISSFITARRITTPLRVLSTSARRLEHGDYGARVQVASQDEIGELAHRLRPCARPFRPAKVKFAAWLIKTP